MFRQDLENCFTDFRFKQNKYGNRLPLDTNIQEVFFLKYQTIKFYNLLKLYLRFPFPLPSAHPFTCPLDTMEVHISDDEVSVEHDQPQGHQYDKHKPRHIPRVLKKGQVAVSGSNGGGCGDCRDDKRDGGDVCETTAVCGC